MTTMTMTVSSGATFIFWPDTRMCAYSTPFGYTWAGTFGTLEAAILLLQAERGRN